MNVDQESLDFGLWAQPGAAGVRGSAKVGRAHAGRRGLAAPHGPHPCGGCSAIWAGTSTAHCAGCHSTFATVGLFDAHRSIAGDCGTCRDPATVTNRAGERVMFCRDGMWRAPEMTGAGKVFGERAS